MSPSEILARLDQRFRLLTAAAADDAAERHQTLHAAIDWSYELLDADEQALLQRLSVFVGDFDLAAATAMAADAGSTNSTPSIGWAHSSRSRWSSAARRDGVSRYRLLETIRQYAAEQLDAEGAPSGRVTPTPRTTSPPDAQLFAMLETARDFEALEQLRVDTPNLAAASALVPRHRSPPRRPRVLRRHRMDRPRSGARSSCRTSSAVSPMKR